MSETHSADVRVAIADVAPRLLDIDANIETAVDLINRASAEGALLVAFGEAWLTGYPLHVTADPGSDLWWRFAAAYLEQTIEVPGPAVDALCDAARAGGIDVIIGASEREPSTQGTLYSTQLLIGAEGKLLGRHRKLRPSPHERSAWADGDAASLLSHPRDYGFLSGLMSNEHQMAAPAYLLAEQGTQFHVASWPGGEVTAPGARRRPWQHQHLLSRSFAVQTGAFVICAGGRLDEESLPEPYRALFAPLFTGDSAVIDPLGGTVETRREGDDLLVADCAIELIAAAKVAFDCTGHSARVDQLEIRNHAAAGDTTGDGWDGYSDNISDDPDGAGYDDPPPFDELPSHDDGGPRASAPDEPATRAPHTPSESQPERQGISRRDLFRRS